MQSEVSAHTEADFQRPEKRTEQGGVQETLKDGKGQEKQQAGAFDGDGLRYRHPGQRDRVYHGGSTEKGKGGGQAERKSACDLSSGETLPQTVKLRRKAENRLG